MPKRTDAELEESNEHLSEAIRSSRKDAAGASKWLKSLADREIPKGLRKPRQTLLGAIRHFIAKQREANAARRERRKANREELHDRQKPSGAAAAVAYAQSKIGTQEQPVGSNWGGLVEVWIKFLGYAFAVPWCGCFVGYCSIQAGGAKIPNRQRLGYTPYIVDDARAHANGLTAVPVDQARPGDFITFDFDGGGTDHVGLCEKPTSGGYVHCVEGNTSNGLSGSQANGDGVYRRSRPTSQVTCVARPTY